MTEARAQFHVLTNQGRIIACKVGAAFYTSPVKLGSGKYGCVYKLTSLTSNISVPKAVIVKQLTHDTEYKTEKELKAHQDSDYQKGFLNAGFRAQRESEFLRLADHFGSYYVGSPYCSELKVSGLRVTGKFNVFILGKYQTGIVLNEYLNKYEPLPALKYYRLMGATVDAFSKLPATLAHCDVNDGNLICEEKKADYVVKLIDFGLACKLPDDTHWPLQNHNWRQSDVGNFPPEFMTTPGTRKVTKASDIWRIARVFRDVKTQPLNQAFTNVIHSMMEADVAKRLTPDEIQFAINIAIKSDHVAMDSDKIYEWFYYQVILLSQIKETFKASSSSKEYKTEDDYRGQLKLFHEVNKNLVLTAFNLACIDFRDRISKIKSDKTARNLWCAAQAMRLVETPENDFEKFIFSFSKLLQGKLTSTEGAEMLGNEIGENVERLRATLVKADSHHAGLEVLTDMVATFGEDKSVAALNLLENLSKVAPALFAQMVKSPEEWDSFVKGLLSDQAEILKLYALYFESKCALLETEIENSLPVIPTIKIRFWFFIKYTMKNDISEDSYKELLIAIFDPTELLEEVSKAVIPVMAADFHKQFAHFSAKNQYLFYYGFLQHSDQSEAKEHNIPNFASIRQAFHVYKGDKLKFLDLIGAQRLLRLAGQEGFGNDQPFLAATYKYFLESYQIELFKQQASNARLKQDFDSGSIERKLVVVAALLKRKELTIQQLAIVASDSFLKKFHICLLAGHVSQSAVRTVALARGSILAVPGTVGAAGEERKPVVKLA